MNLIKRLGEVVSKVITSVIKFRMRPIMFSSWSFAYSVTEPSLFQSTGF